MSKNIAVPEDLYNKAAEFAARNQVSVDEFVASILASRFASADYIASRAKVFNREQFEWALNQIPDAEPEEGDRF